MNRGSILGIGFTVAFVNAMGLAATVPVDFALYGLDGQLGRSSIGVNKRDGVRDRASGNS